MVTTMMIMVTTTTTVMLLLLLLLLLMMMMMMLPRSLVPQIEFRMVPEGLTIRPPSDSAILAKSRSLEASKPRPIRFILEHLLSRHLRLHVYNRSYAHACTHVYQHLCPRLCACAAMRQNAVGMFHWNDLERSKPIHNWAHMRTHAHTCLHACR